VTPMKKNRSGHVHQVSSDSYHLNVC